MSIYGKRKDVSAIYWQDKVITEVFYGAKLVWELISSSFLDKFGNVFYDKNGVPFQGRQ